MFDKMVVLILPSPLNTSIIALINVEIKIKIILKVFFNKSSPNTLDSLLLAYGALSV